VVRPRRGRGRGGCGAGCSAAARDVIMLKGKTASADD
jgi:hypothetical protein